MTNKFGNPPQDLGFFPVEGGEVFYFLYLPISLPGQIGYTLPKSLHQFISLIDAVRIDEPDRFEAEHVYVTGRRMYVGPEISANRPGWHSDGFGTDDLNYIWYDALPTVFNNGPFVNIPDNDKMSLKEFEKQADETMNYSFGNKCLLRLDPSVIHRVAGNPDRQFIRTFVKISISKHRYDLEHNSINHDLDYSWKQRLRKSDRNSPHSEAA